MKPPLEYNGSIQGELLYLSFPFGCVGPCFQKNMVAGGALSMPFGVATLQQKAHFGHWAQRQVGSSAWSLALRRWGSQKS